MSTLWLPEDVWKLVLPNINNYYKGVLRLVCKHWLSILKDNYPLTLLEFVRMGRINLIKWSLNNCDKEYYKNKSILLYEAAKNNYSGIFKLLSDNGIFFDDKTFIYLVKENNIKGLNILIKNNMIPSKRTIKELLTICKNKEFLNWLKKIN